MNTDLSTAFSFADLAPRPLIEHVAIGVFDGFHLGHQAVIQRLLSMTKDPQTTAVVTFDPHPLAVIAPERTPPRLTSLQQRSDLFRQAGVGETIIIRFDETVRDLSAENFIEELQRLFPHLKSITVGKRWSFGKNRQGNAEMLMKMGASHHFTVNEVEPVHYDGGPVSSTFVRETINSRRFDLTEKLLKRSYTIEGTVSQGAGRGKKIGFPTANLSEIFQMLPPPGVYGCIARGKEQKEKRSFLSVLNVGKRPTFGENNELTVEVHLLDFSGDLYGKKLELSHFHFVREERSFRSVEALRSQIEHDIVTVRREISLTKV